MPYLCTTDHSLKFETIADLHAAQQEATASGDVARMNTLFDLTWVEPETAS